MADAKGGDSAKDKKAAQAAKKKAEAEKKAATEAKKKAEAENIPLPDDVALYIAGKIKSNIRELEGSLIRLIAYASLTGRQISLPLAQDVLRNILDRDDAKVTIDVIQKSVATRYSLKVSDLKSKNSSKLVAEPRQIAMYLCKSLTSASLPQIGKSFGGKHHSTVIHSIRKIEARRKQDASFNSLMETLMKSFDYALHRPVFHSYKPPLCGRFVHFLTVGVSAGICMVFPDGY